MTDFSLTESRVVGYMRIKSHGCEDIS